MTPVEMLRPTSIAEASQMLADHPGEARVLAGGSALVLMLTQRLIAPRYLVSLDNIPGLRQINDDPGIGIQIGALVTHHQLESWPAVRERFPALADTFHQVASIRLRNQATVGGVLCEADYASDPPATLLALGAVVRAVGRRGERWIDLPAFFQDFYQTALAPDEILTDIFVPEMEADARAIYLKFRTRSAEDRPCVGVAALVERRREACTGLRVVVGAVAATPQTLPEVDERAIGRRLGEDLAREIGAAYAAAIQPISDLRGSDVYRRQVIEVLVRRAILQAGAPP
jgi:carbon-monoxide dehydrogenase medium subunit